MSGEYYCIEEVDPSYYYGDFETKSTRSSKAGRQNFPSNHDNDARSTTSRKSQDSRLYEIEEQLEVAENRCNTLKGQLDCMKKIYQKSSKAPLPPSKPSDSFSSRKNYTGETAPSRKGSRKRPSSPPVHQRSRPCSPTKKRTVPHRYHESTDSIPQKSSSSSTAVVKTTVNLMRPPNEQFSGQLIRQNAASIGTDHSGAAVRTINNILTGITDSVNRLSKLHMHDNKKPKKRGKDAVSTSEVGTSVFSVPIRSGTPQGERRFFQVQKKIDEVPTNVEAVNEKSLTEDWNPKEYSITSIKSRAVSKTRWSRHTSSKTATKTKIQSSSGSVNLAKSVKSTAKHVENTTKMRNGRTSMVEDDSQSMILSRKRKRSVKRLKQASKLSLGRKHSDYGTQRHLEEFTNDNLVELYHNIAAKGSESDDSNNPSKSQITRQKGGGDLVLSQAQVVPKFEVNPEEFTQKKPVNRNYQLNQRMLTPINENTQMDENFNTVECLSNTPRNYELPTIASKMKQVTKAYFQSFNFRSIPFCAAKSTTPSHNIGINIQQVMSIIKTRQPITGISATLAHNISLAAEKLQSRPLSVLVSTLSSKMGYGGASQCPLIRGSMNREQLQEMAKEIKEEPEDELVDRIQNESVTNTEPCSRGACGDIEEPETIWSVAPGTQKRCTCASQKGVPFQQVLSKYQMSSDAICVPSRAPTMKSQASRRFPKATCNPAAMRTQATRNWIRNEAAQAVQATQSTVSKKSDKHSLNGREKNLKTVLQNLHDEFDALNTKYEQVAKGVDKNDPKPNPEVARDLDEMEKLLNKKEEEINMVMALYTEVLALKDQVKKLKDRGSQPSIVLSQNPSKTCEYKNPNAALHLTQLLRQIQQYQIRYKNTI